MGTRYWFIYSIYVCVKSSSGGVIWSDDRKRRETDKHAAALNLVFTQGIIGQLLSKLHKN